MSQEGSKSGGHRQGTVEAAAWVARFAPLIPRGEVLDLACGHGRHSRLLAALGHQVTAVDRDADALAGLAQPGIAVQQRDLETGSTDAWPFAPDRFAGIVVVNYLHRPLFGAILASLRPGGVLIYETFVQGNERFGKPSNPDFLLKSGELLEVVRTGLAQPFQVIAFENGYVDTPKPAMLQRICAVKPGGLTGSGAVLYRLDPI